MLSGSVPEYGGCADHSEDSDSSEGRFALLGVRGFPLVSDRHPDATRLLTLGPAQQVASGLAVSGLASALARPRTADRQGTPIRRAWVRGLSTLTSLGEHFGAYPRRSTISSTTSMPRCQNFELAMSRSLSASSFSGSREPPARRMSSTSSAKAGSSR